MFDVEDSDGSIAWVLEKLGAPKKAKGISAPKAPAVEPAKKAQDLTLKRAGELELWKVWKAGGEKPKHLDPLLKSLNPVIQRRAMEAGRGRVEVPSAAIDFELKKHVVKALRTYDPSRGAQLTSWISTNLKKASRFIHNTQNATRITEPLAMKIGAYNAVKSELTERLGHSPDDQSLHEALIPHGFSMKDIKRLNKEIRKSYISGQGGLDDVQTSMSSSLENEVIQLVIPQLSKPELAVHEFTFGLNGKPKLAPGQIAKKLKMDNSKVSKLRTSAWEKMKPHLG